MSKGVRIYDLARRLAVPSRDLLEMLRKRGIEAKSHMSTVDSSTADLILEAFSAKRTAESQKKDTGKRPRPPEKQERGAPKSRQEQRPGGKEADQAAKQKRQQPDVRSSAKKKSRPQPKPEPRKPEQRGQKNKRDRSTKPRKDRQARPEPPSRRTAHKPGSEGGKETEAGEGRKSRREAGRRRGKRRPEDQRQQEDKRKGAKTGRPSPQAQDQRTSRPPQQKRQQPRGGKQRARPTRGRQQAKKTAPAPKAQAAPKVEEKQVPSRLEIPDVIMVKELADKMMVPPAKVIQHLMTMGIMANVNQVLDPEAATSIAESFGFEIATPSTEDETARQEETIDEAKLRPRPPVVTIMGHVDHGKTTLLDAIRESKITDSEFGGITQHIGAYAVEVDQQKIVFLDTPGHEAFTAMRARGAKVTDAVVLVVAADDGIMPQSIEAIDHARAADVPIIVAINKIDVPGANPDRVMQELTKYGLTPEDWGGETICVQVSAKQRRNLDDLLEMILLQAEMLELKADPDRPAKGVIVEALLDKGRGPVATVLVQSGTLRIGAPFVAGLYHGKVRAMLDEYGQRVDEAGPATPVEVLGATGVPVAGDPFFVADNEREARQKAESLQEQQQKTEFLKTAKITLEELHQQIKEGEIQELRIVIKADVHGSVEALSDALSRLSTDEVRLQVIHGGVGAINESDVMLAAASNAIVLGFNVRPVAKAREMAEKEQIDVRLYTVIYQAIKDIKEAMEGLLEPTYKEVLEGQAQVLALFTVPKVGAIAGCRVVKGKVTRNSVVRVLRGNQEIFKGNIASLRRVKDDVREVLTGYECGIRLENFNDIQVDDVIEAYTLEKVTRTLEEATAKKA